MTEEMVEIVETSVTEETVETVRRDYSVTEKALDTRKQ